MSIRPSMTSWRAAPVCLLIAALAACGGKHDDNDDEEPYTPQTGSAVACGTTTNGVVADPRTCS